MNEKLPQEVRHIETTKNIPPTEGIPVVENMQIGFGDVLVKISFPRPGSVAKIFILVQAPVSDEGVKNYEKMLKETPEEHKKSVGETFEAMNSPVVFRSLKEAQKWFDLASYTFEPAERRTIADFLEVEYKED